jgi:peptidoglycan hydrolase-like protein with peptidoglycan-binding domain
MLTLITTFAPLILSLGGFLINLFVKDQASAAQAKANLQAWVDANKGDSVESAGEHAAYQAQIDELISVLPLADQSLIRANGPNLKQGDNGPFVALLQTKLNGVGYAIPVDFDFGPVTTAAVNSFKTKHGLPVDGVVDWAVWQAFGKEANA